MPLAFRAASAAQAKNAGTGAYLTDSYFEGMEDLIRELAERRPVLLADISPTKPKAANGRGGNGHG